MTADRATTATLVGVSLVLVACAACATDQRPSLQPGPSSAPTTAVPSAEDVKAGIRRGLAAIRTLRAEVATRQHGRERRKLVEVTSEGVSRETEYTEQGDRVTVHDAARGVRYGTSVGPGSIVQAFGASGLPPGRQPPILPSFGDGPIIEDPVLLSRRVLDWSAFPVTTTTLDGRPAWVAQWSGPRRIEPDHIVVTVDVRSGVALRAEGFLDNQPVYEVRVVSLEIDGDLTIVPPPSVSTEPLPEPERNYNRTTLEEVAAVAGYQPVAPTWVPPGFTRGEVGFAVQSRSVTEFLHPDSTHIVSTVYRRGFDELIVTTRLRGSRPWTNPLGIEPTTSAPPGEMTVPSSPPIEPLFRWEPVTVSGGAFAGAQAERTTLAPYGRSVFWALNAQLSLIVQGDVTAEEMQRIVESLRPL